MTAPFDIEIAPGALGAEIRGLDLATIADDAFDILLEAWHASRHRERGLAAERTAVRPSSRVLVHDMARDQQRPAES